MLEIAKESFPGQIWNTQVKSVCEAIEDFISVNWDMNVRL